MSVTVYIADIVRSEDETKREAESRTASALISRALGSGASLEHDDDGVPFVTDPDGVRFDINISISHTDTMCALAVSDSPVGIDIEAPRTQLERVAGRFLTPAERERGQFTLDDLLRIWTAKESTFKCAGIPELVISEIETIPGDDRDNYFPVAARARDQLFSISYRMPGLHQMLAVATPINENEEIQVTD